MRPRERLKDGEKELMDWDPLDTVGDLVDHFVHRGLFVAGSGHDVFVVSRDVTAQDRRGFF